MSERFAQIPKPLQELLYARGQLPPPVIAYTYGGEDIKSVRSQATAEGWKGGYDSAVRDLIALGVIDPSLLDLPAAPDGRAHKEEGADEHERARRLTAWSQAVHAPQTQVAVMMTRQEITALRENVDRDAAALRARIEQDRPRLRGEDLAELEAKLARLEARSRELTDTYFAEVSRIYFDTLDRAAA